MDARTGSEGPEGPGLFMTELRVPDWPGAVAWFVAVLGLRVVLRDEPGRFALLSAGGGMLALKGSAHGDPSPGPSGVRLVFLVADVDAEFVRLGALGVAVSPPADSPTEPYREARLVAPCGTPVTLFSWKRDAPGV